MTDVFGGRVGYMVCSQVSGQDCSRPVASDAEHCGIPEHQRIVPVDQPRGEAEYRSRARRRPTIVVDEEFDVVDVAGEPVAFDPETFDPGEVWVATRVQRQFTAYHGVTAEEAIANIRLVLDRAAQGDKHRQLEDGSHRFWWGGFTVRLSADLGVVLRYKTNHYERTPQMVADGVKSRLAGARKGPARVRRPIPEDVVVGATYTATVSKVVDFGAFIELGDCDGLLHRSEMGLELGEVHGALSEGDVVRVEVTAVDRDENKVSLRPLP